METNINLIELDQNSLTDLRAFAKNTLGLADISNCRKAELITRIQKALKEESDKAAAPAEPKDEAAPEDNSSTSPADGILDIMQDGFGFLRPQNCYISEKDVYVSSTFIRRAGLRPGDRIKGFARPLHEGEKHPSLCRIETINGRSYESSRRRPRFASLVPIYPDSRLKLEPAEGKGNTSARMIDLLAPIGKGQRGLIVSPPKAGKTTLLKQIANGITQNHPEVKLFILLIDERPEEVTDMQRSTKADVIFSTFDEHPEHHTKVAETMLEHSKRLVESGEDVVILLDSITRLARSYNLTVPPSGRTLSGGLDPAALFQPKAFFGAARNIEHGGSLTVIATALVDTGSKMDDVIYEEFKGTGNMEIHLSRRLSEKRIFPAIDPARSGTRRDDLLLSKTEYDAMNNVRRNLAESKNERASELIINTFASAKTNAQLITALTEKGKQ
ncbi:MAG: transcription termination factor Rho [Clostridia bacterium]|nr:transcription termination factor Rho [Clostridia bacterium]